MNKDNEHFSAFTLLHTFRGHQLNTTRFAWSPDGHILAIPSRDQTIHLWNIEQGQLIQSLAASESPKWFSSVAWSPDGQMLASGSGDTIIRLWNVQTGEQFQIFSGHFRPVTSLAWSPKGRLLASGSDDYTVRLWDTQTKQHLETFAEHLNIVSSVVWSSDGQMLASSSLDGSIKLWDTKTRKHLRTLRGHTDQVFEVAWSPNGQMLASCSGDRTIRLWNPQSGLQMHTLEGHSDWVTNISFSSDGNLLASKANDDTVRLWRTDSWRECAVLEESTKHYWLLGLAFHPKASVLATPSEEEKVIQIWKIDSATLLKTASDGSSIYYANAKVVLVGDSGVGKSGLGLVLSGQNFVPTESTHGRRIWTFDSRDVDLGDGFRELREILLWDLAGQPGYRLIHQLHLNEVALALVVFDAHSETDPFVGVHHWSRALRQAQNALGNSVLSVKKLLVAARTDRGGTGVSLSRIKSLMSELGFDRYFETSAREGKNIVELIDAIKQEIDWTALPKVSSTDLYQCIKDFLLSEKEAGRVLSSVEDLYHTFLKSFEWYSETEHLYSQFETCIGLVESRGLIRSLSFGNLILLQPELLDAYASALINVVKDEPDGLGSIAEEKVKVGNFPIPKDERMPNKEQEKLLLIAMIEDLLRYEIALREQVEDGPYLIFPSQSTRENPDLPDPEGKTVTYAFEGPLLNIFATLAVRLSHSGLFKRKELWKNAVTYTTRTNGTCGVFLRDFSEGRGELTLFFEKVTGEETRLYFEEYILVHLKRYAIPESIRRQRIFVCPNCNEPFTNSQVRHRRELGFDWIRCGVCEKRVSILDSEEQPTIVDQMVLHEMDQAANNRRDRETSVSTLQGKMVTKDFDVFLCHNNKDKPKVKEIGEKLKEHGILPWLDEWELRPGEAWPRLLEQQIGQIKSAAVFVGRDGIGPWQYMELEAFLREFVKRRCPVIPILLRGAPRKPELPLFLRGMTWVDFRKRDPDPMEQLIWGITGERFLDQ